MVTSGKLAVYDAPKKPFEIRAFPIRPPRPDEVLVKIRMSNHPRHLIQALDFVATNRKRFPFHELVDGKYKLEDVGQAMQDAMDRKVLRAAIVP